jgi:hypothetical protein
LHSLPQPLEKQRGADAPHRHLYRLALAARLEHHCLLDKTRTRFEHPLELAAFFQFVEPAERADHALAHRGALALALHDLQIDPPLRLLLAEIHAPVVGAHRISQQIQSCNNQIAATWH